MEGGGAGIDDDGLMVRDQIGAGFGDGFLFRELVLIANGESELIRARVDDARAAVGAAVVAGGFENGEVASNGGDRGIDHLGQFVEGSELGLLQVILDPLLSFFGLHSAMLRRWVWKILEDFAIFHLTKRSIFGKWEGYKHAGLMQGMNLHRAVVEHWVRQSVYERLGKPLPKAAGAPNPLVVNVSARHCHLTQEAVEALFGVGHKLTPMKWLYQEGQFAAKESVTLIGPRSRVISNLRILGPCRTLNQIELAYTDSIALGFDIPLRSSGNIKGTPGAMIMGPAGFFEMPDGVIRALRHVHMSPVDAEYYGVKNGEDMRLKIGGPCGVSFDKLLVRVDPSFKLEVHIDTDEGNACNLQANTPCELVK